MNRTQQYVLAILDKVRDRENLDPEQRSVLDRIKSRLAAATDLSAELRRLFRVRGFADAALGLLWVADQTDRDPSRFESTPEEESFIAASVRKALGAGGTPPAIAAADAPFPAAEEAPSLPDADAGSSVEEQVGSALDRFIEAVQSGSETRDSLLVSVIQQCDILTTSSGSPKEAKQFAYVLREFLRYVAETQLLDDVRAMNIISNVQEPYVQWMRMDPAGRVNVLDQSIGILRDAKAMFE